MSNDAPLHHALSRSLPEPTTPTTLHGSIMNAVRSAGQPAPAPRKPPLALWLAGPIAAVLFGAIWAWHLASRPAPQVALDRIGAALGTSEEIVSAAPDSTLAPLTLEWQRLNQDLTNGAQFVLAALP
ncbi:MAG TPA: hypothetical protein VMU04_01350 [Candidatus Acidoferrum sp.]|nr:hypothetical protein [Candidatus Acidoferrum sp.]